MKLVAKTMQGLESILAAELKEIGAQDIQIATRAVEFEGDKKVLYRANYELRTAIRVLVPFYQFRARHENHFYKKVMEFDWSQIMSPNHTFAIDAAVKSKYFNHSKYLALKTKDAIVDQFRERGGIRPNIDTDRPDFRFNLHVFEDQCSLALDSSGASLHRRGYRQKSLEAPINEVLAAGMIMLSGWKGDLPLIDPMCGSGTIPIEAALIAQNIPPQILKERFGFHQWKDFDETIWQEVVANAKSKIKESSVAIYATDIDPEARHLARQNATLIGVADSINFDRKEFEQWLSPSEEGLLVMNPPYDERLQTTDVADFYQRIGDKLKSDFAGWSAWIISSNFDALKKVGLRPSKKYTLFNGKLECKFQKFEMFKGKRLDFLIQKENK